MAENPDPERGATDHLVRQLRTTSDAAAGTAHLPSAERVRARGDQRRHRRNAAVGLTALVLVGGLAAGALGRAGDDRAPAPPAATTPTVPTPDPTPVTPADLLDGSREVDVLAPDGPQLTATVEGALVVSPDAEAAAGGVSTAWIVRPTSGGDVQLVGVGARADGRDLCADVADAETVGFEFCDPARPSQAFTPETGTAGSGTVDAGGGGVSTSALFRSAAGYLVVAGDHLVVDPDERAATWFTLRDRGPAQEGP